MGFLDDAVASYIDKSRGDGFRANANWPSRLGSDCGRQLQWHRTKDVSDPIPLQRKRIFKLGEMLEQPVLRMLQDAGVTVAQWQRPVRDEDLQVSGKIDGTVKIPDGRVLVLDAKTASAGSFRRIQKMGTAAAMLEDDHQYVRGYVISQAIYARTMGLQGSLLFVVNKETLDTCTVEVMLDDPIVAEALAVVDARLRKVNQAIVDKVDLPAEPGDYCRECPFLKACLPNRDFGAGVALMMNQEVIDVLDEWTKLKPTRDDWEKSDAQLKRIFEKPGEFVAGPFSVTVKAGQTTKYDLPDPVKAQYAVKVPTLRRSYVRMIEEGVPAPAEPFVPNALAVDVDHVPADKRPTVEVPRELIRRDAVGSIIRGGSKKSFLD